MLVVSGEWQVVHSTGMRVDHYHFIDEHYYFASIPS